MTCKLMIVDDDEDIRESLVDLLQTEGYETVGVASGRGRRRYSYGSVSSPGNRSMSSR